MKAGRRVIGARHRSILVQKISFSCWKMTSRVSKWLKSACVLVLVQKNQCPSDVRCSFNLYFPLVLHMLDCRSEARPSRALMRRCVCTVPAMQGMLDHQMKSGMGIAPCTSAACFPLETDVSCHSPASLYNITVIVTQQTFWRFVFIPNYHQVQSGSDSALLSNICLKRQM